jgi:hypothetical protein
MSVESFIPAVWSAKLFTRLRKQLVAAGIVNTDYEGEIKDYGDRVKINEVGPISVNNYAKYGTLSWAELSSAQKELIIDQAKSFSFKVDDIDTAQVHPKLMNAAMEEAAYAIADEIDQFILGLYAQAGVTNTTYMGSSASPISVSSGNVILTLSFAGRYLTEKNVPQANRFMVITAWLHQKMLLAEIGGIAATAVPKVFDNGALTSGFVGQALGFNFLVSNNVAESATAVSAIVAGNRQAISYAGQIAKVKAVELQDSFGEGVKGLYVYGAKVVRPNALAALHLTEVAG